MRFLHYKFNEFNAAFSLNSGTVNRKKIIIFL